MNALVDYILPRYNFDCKLGKFLNFYTIDEVVEEIIDAIAKSIANLPDTGSTYDYQDLLTLARDFYFTPDLTRSERDYYYKKLTDGGFFKLVNASLYASDAGVCNYAIYTIGKFSHRENAILLEHAYETCYRYQNPFLCQRCLFELSWLGSKKYELYVSELEAGHSATSLFILLYLWDVTANKGRLKNLRYNKYLVALLPPHNSKDRPEMLSNRLLQFSANPPASVCPQETISIPKDVFEEEVTRYFKYFDDTKFANE